MSRHLTSFDSGAGRYVVTGVDVVVVEQDRALAQPIRRTLESGGCRTRWIDDGREAVTALAGGAEPALRPRVVLLGWDLPGIDGLGVLACMLGAGALKRTRVVMRADGASEADLRHARMLGVHEQVTEPSTVAELVAVVYRALRRSAEVP